jgi:hypothetical protein
MKSTARVSVAVVGMSIAMTFVAACASSDDGAAERTTTTTSTESSTVKLDAPQAERRGLEEGDEVTVETAPTTVVEGTTTTTPAAQTANDKFVEETLAATGLADAEGEQDYPSYTRVLIPGGYSAEVPAEWVSNAVDDGDSITLNAQAWIDFKSGVQIAPRTGEPQAILEAHAAGDYDERCTTKGSVMPYDDGHVKGASKSFQGCVADAATTVIAGTIDGDPSGKVILLDAVVSEPRDVRALARILATLSAPS